MRIATHIAAVALVAGLSIPALAFAQSNAQPATPAAPATSATPATPATPSANATHKGTMHRSTKAHTSHKATAKRIHKAPTKAAPPAGDSNK